MLFGQHALMVLVWRAFAAGMGLTSRVHGALPPADAPAVWLANHFNTLNSARVCRLKQT